jgi:hypothetical protein
MVYGVVDHDEVMAVENVQWTDRDADGGLLVAMPPAEGRQW